jgi:hypothetical protein
MSTSQIPRQRRRTVPTQLAAIAVGVPEATIRKWASRGKLTRYDRPGRAEYNLDELYIYCRKLSLASHDPDVFA